MFEEAGTGRHLRAFEIQGLNIPVGGASVTQAAAQANPALQPPLSEQFANPQSQQWMRPPTGTYYRAPGMVDPAAKQVATTAVILGILSIFCGCLPAAIVALVMGINAQSQANNGD